MQSAPLPQNEPWRLKKLQGYKILDTPTEDAFERICRIAAETIGVPIALVSLVDKDRQWFKSHYGVDASETPREIAFCAHAILGNQVFIVEDATQDTRFHDNPLVSGDPSIRFYAGAPLKSPDGYNLGTLCIIDKKPRQLSQSHHQLLDDLARLVVNEMELRLALQESMNDAAASTVQMVRQNEFLSIISHELRSPLTSIHGTLGLLENGILGDLSDQAMELVSSANRNAMHLITLVNDLLDIQKLDEGKLDFDFVTVDIVALVKDVCESMASIALEKQLKLIQQVDSVPAIVADPVRLRQALLNLLSNAIKFAPHHSAVTVSARCDGEFVELAVTDKGPGVPEHLGPRLFQRFVQAKGPQQSKGSGLGLAITRMIAEAHNGSIDYRSIPDVETRFFMHIPMRQSLVGN